MLASLVVIYSPTSFKYSVYTGIQWPEVNTVQIQCIHCIQEGNLWLRAARGRGRGRGRKYRWTTTQRSRSRARGGRAARGGRLTVGHVVCSRRAPVADATALPPHRRQRRRRRTPRRAHVMHDRRHARRQQSRHARCVGQISDACIYSCSFQIHCIYRIQWPKPNTVNTYITSR